MDAAALYRARLEEKLDGGQCGQCVIAVVKQRWSLMR
jgi:hypothetical protein